MLGLLTDEEKAQLAADLDEAVKTFLEPIVVYIGAEKIIVSTNPNYNRFDANDQNVLQPEADPNRYVLNARIEYDAKQKNPFMIVRGQESAEDNQLKLREPQSDVRIKVDNSGAALIRQSKQIELDGKLFTLNSVERPHGLFSGTYSTFFYIRVK